MTNQRYSPEFKYEASDLSRDAIKAMREIVKDLRIEKRRKTWPSEISVLKLLPV